MVKLLSKINKPTSELNIEKPNKFNFERLKYNKMSELEKGNLRKKLVNYL